VFPKILSLVLLVVALPSLYVRAESPSCTYTTYKWNTHLRRSVEHRTVRHSYSELQAAEIHDATGCTVCEEDQMEIRLPGVEPFRVCRLLEPDVRHALDQALQQGEKILSVKGYRVGMTKGETDAQGNRTRFSNHSFGVALDINERHNGLYDHCLAFGPNCRLLRGGVWDPARSGSLTSDSPVVRALEVIGLKWGGEIEGNQKDFMHFSPTGY
jgi:hypothetical protein